MEMGMTLPAGELEIGRVELARSFTLNAIVKTPFLGSLVKPQGC